MGDLKIFFTAGAHTAVCRHHQGNSCQIEENNSNKTFYAHRRFDVTLSISFFLLTLWICKFPLHVNSFWVRSKRIWRWFDSNTMPCRTLHTIDIVEMEMRLIHRIKMKTENDCWAFRSSLVSISLRDNLSPLLMLLFFSFLANIAEKKWAPIKKSVHTMVQNRIKRWSKSPRDFCNSERLYYKLIEIEMDANAVANVNRRQAEEWWLVHRLMNFPSTSLVVVVGVFISLPPWANGSFT